MTESNASDAPQFTEIQVTNEDNEMTPVTRDHEAPGASHRGSRAASTLGAPSIKRTPSMARRSEFNDDAEREKAHLREANEKLQAKLEAQRNELQSIQEEGRANMNVTEKKSLETIEAENEAFRNDIKALREKLKVVCDVEQLDTLQDTLAEKQLEVKSLELKKRTLSDKGRSRLRTLKTLDTDSVTSPQAVFLDLKSERKRHQKRIDKLRAELDRVKESIPPVEEKVEELKQKETAAELTDVTKEDIEELKQLDETQVKELERLRRRIGALDMSFDARGKHIVWATRDLNESIAQYKAEAAALEAQIAKLEQTITANHVATKSAPPHFVKPLPPPAQTGSESQPNSPRPPKARTTAPRPQPAPPQTSAKPAAKEEPKAKPAPPTKSKPSAAAAQSPKKEASTAPAPAPAQSTTAAAADTSSPGAAPDSRHSSSHQSDHGQRLNDIDDDSQNHSGKHDDDEYEDDTTTDHAEKKKEEEPTFLTA